MISVIIPLYNKEKQVAHTLESVLSQTFQRFEIVVVNDGSTDNSVAEVEKIGDSRIRLIHQKNGGVSAARNRGIEDSKYELLAFLDADDEWKPEYLEAQYNLFEKYPMCSVYACNYEFRNVEGRISSTIIRKLPFVEQEGILSNYFEVACCSHPPLWTSAILVKKESILSIGGFPVGVKSGEDLLTWAGLALKYKIAYVTVPYATFIQNRPNKKIPKRQPDAIDYGGESLISLYLEFQNLSMKKYISSYYKGRAIHALECSLVPIAFNSIKKSIFYNIFYVKNYLLLAVCILPKQVIKRICNKQKQFS